MFTLSDQKKSEPCKGEMDFFLYWNPLPRTQNFKTEFYFQTSLVQNSPFDILELLSFGAHLDLPWGCRFLEIPLKDSSLLLPVGVY